MKKDITMLDSKEYLHLAIHATQQGLHHFAMEYLYKVLDKEPENAAAIFLLAAEHAELGLYDRAIEGMLKCISLSPEIEMAHYQLALLYIQKNEQEKAFPLWQHLAENANDESIKLFSRGITIVEKSKNNALEYIDQAIETSRNNQFLQKSMRSIRENIMDYLSQMDSSPSLQQDDTVHAIFINTYKHASFSSDDEQ